MSIRTGVLFVILVVAAAGSWLLGGTPARPAIDSRESGQIRSGYYMLDANVRGYDQDGSYLYELNAREIAEDRDASVVHLDDVELVYRDAAKVPWTLTATEGVLSNDGSRLVLSGNVLASNVDGATPASLRTTLLTVDPQRYELSTTARVTLTVGERSISATGMLAFLNEDRIEFQSNVNGKFLP